MLILDVRTWWASTHQMFRVSCNIHLQVLISHEVLQDGHYYCDMIDSFVSRNKDLHAFELSNTDWESIKLVTSWLKSFRAAIMEMSTTKVPMLLTTHLRTTGQHQNYSCDLPDSVSPNIKMGLTDAHHKLSDYYYQYNASPFYTWAACMCQIICMTITFLIK
jgi:hypothetical protein